MHFHVGPFALALKIYEQDVDLGWGIGYACMLACLFRELDSLVIYSLLPRYLFVINLGNIVNQFTAADSCDVEAKEVKSWVLG